MTIYKYSCFIICKLLVYSRGAFTAELALKNSHDAMTNGMVSDGIPSGTNRVLKAPWTRTVKITPSNV